MASDFNQPFVDDGGYVWIPHPEGRREPECVAGCNPMSNGVRHHRHCAKVEFWRRAFLLRVGGREVLMAKRKPGDPKTPAEQRKVDAMWQRCPYCGMEPGTYCVTEWGETAYTPHKARYDVVGGKL